MSHVKQALADVVGMASVGPLSQAAAWYLNVARHFPEIVRTRKFYSADNAMARTARFAFRGKQFEFDLTGLPPQSFSWLREFFVRDTYFGAFDIGRARVDTFVDLGCNVGRVSQIVAKAFDCVRIVAVDADDHAASPVRAGIGTGVITFIQALVTSRVSRPNGFRRDAYDDAVKKYGGTFNANARTITVPEILALLPNGRADFMKIDIEGAEFDILLNDNGWLDSVGSLTMEVHRAIGDPADIIHELSRRGFDTAWRDNYASDARMERAEFIYASRDHLLKSVMLPAAAA